MGEQSHRGLAERIDTTTEPSWRKSPAGAPIELDAAISETSSGQVSGEESAYCRGRAEAETRRARQAADPAARAAHLEMASLYRKRVLAAEQGVVPEAQAWARQDGSLPAEG
jgi:hypothetical protein